MDKDTVMQLLKEYKQNKARARYLEATIQRKEAEVKDLKRNAVEDSVCITQHLTGMPHSTGISNPVEGLAVRLLDGEYPEHIMFQIHRLHRLQDEWRELCYKTECVEIWLEALNERQRFTVETTLIEGYTWTQAENLYEERHTAYYSKEGLRKIRNGAIDLICQISE